MVQQGMEEGLEEEKKKQEKEANKAPFISTSSLFVVFFLLALPMVHRVVRSNRRQTE